jgi:hypothetical protein
MMRWTLILVCLLAAGTAQAGQVVLTGGSSRTTLADFDTVTISGTKITYTGRALNLSGCDSVFIDGQGDTIVCNTSDSVGTSEDNSYNFVYLNGTTNLLCSAVTFIDNGGGNWNVILEGLNSKRIHFKDCKFVIKGRNSTVLNEPSSEGSGCWRWRFENCTFESQVDSFDSRCQNDAGVTRPRCQDDCIDSQNTAGYYTIWYDHCRITRCPHTGFGLRGRAWVDSCVAYGQAHNDQYDYPSAGACLSADNAYLVAGGDLFPGSRIVGCTLKVYSSDPREGAEGIMLEGPDGTSANRIVVANNYIEVSQGPSDYAGASQGWGIRIRQNSDYGDPPRFVDVYGNKIKVLADTLSATGHVGNMGAGLYFADCGEYVSADSTGDSCRIYKNYFEALADTVANHYGGSAGHLAGLIVELSDKGQGHQFYDNWYVSNVTAVQLGGVNGGASAFHSERDSIKMLSPRFKRVGNPDTTVPIFAGIGSSPWWDNVFVDPYFNGPDEDSASAYVPGSTSAEMFFDVHLVLTVVDSNSSPVNGASVWAVDAYGDTTKGTSNTNGQCSLLVSYDYRNWASGGSDSTYNNYAVGAVYSGDTATASKTVDWAAKTQSLTLSQTDVGGKQAGRRAIKGANIRGGKIR